MSATRMADRQDTPLIADIGSHRILGPLHSIFSYNSIIYNIKLYLYRPCSGEK
ncbi:hypothetical protein GDI3737 [Gluconacetobacter diazotrophicus PA1 5]|uniref:Uncharacterized protein n=1 Tax=Gluconacetobacter diazotrophicus (strain ATCC 49037 / DSM 5601 / CCUG 37298 / CIP 103539 / LMG 7603 / PAl5) TaxID=272568 RepID=A9H7T1_GLUDA|nr:hypothetical protein GDI3737 [Gluconacetobacter diazotrophicus PA1 5]